MKLSFSIIIPVYDRPQEIEELLQSISLQFYKENFEVIVVEDGSKNKCDSVCERFKDRMNLHYYFKENSGAGQSRNFGMQKASGNYFIILDSDVLLPEDYLSVVSEQLYSNFTGAYGGPDAAHHSFTPLQKAINYSMTSVLTTGGIRGKKKGVGKFQPRSFNMGLSRKAFEITKGYSEMTYGEDIDLSFRLWNNGFETQLIEDAFVYHKRRSTIKEFYKQTFNFGTARPILNKKYPGTSKITYWFPSLFIVGVDIAILFAIFVHVDFVIPVCCYFFFIFLDSFIHNKRIKVAAYSVITTYTQFLGYGLGFLKSQFFSKQEEF
ncbi:MAG: glycosyl transferase family 2 [Bacteroidetes bacterium MedPE-SWsnd-G1]|nr:MAG: glycosyl transferase family 2 [Bacteroidetes bacterium MedPE-SWsnd-G1]